MTGWPRPRKVSNASPPCESFSRPTFASALDMDVSELDDEIVNTYGCAIWTSSGAHYEASKLPTERESVFRALIDGEREWDADLIAGSRERFLVDKAIERLRILDQRLWKLGIVHTRIKRQDEIRTPLWSIFGYRAELDERAVVIELSRLVPIWDVRAPDRSFRVGPVFVPGGAFTLTDCGPIVRAHAFRASEGSLGRPAEECSDEWYGRRAFADAISAVRWSVSAIARGCDPEGEP